MAVGNELVAANDPEEVKQEEEDEDEADLVDPHDTLREKCAAKPACVNFKEVMDECTARVTSKTKTTENCSQELMDWMHCVDSCAAQDLFKKLK